MTDLLSIKTEAHLSLSRGEPTALALLDLSGAFDTTDRCTLLSCLKIWFGVRVQFTSYLTEGYQSIKNWFYFDLCKLLFGVTQGSVLGPWLFLCTQNLSVWLQVNTVVLISFLCRCFPSLCAPIPGELKTEFWQDWVHTLCFKKTQGSVESTLPIWHLRKFSLPSWVSQGLGCMVRLWFLVVLSCLGCLQKLIPQLHDFRHVRCFHTQDSSILVANALVSKCSWLDYCNWLFQETPQVQSMKTTMCLKQWC